MNRNGTYPFIGLFLLMGFVIQAQPVNWQAIANENTTANDIRDIGYSENLQLSVAYGSFLTSSGNKTISGFNGTNWINLADSVGGGFNTMVDFQDGILIGGGTPYIGTQNMPHIAYFNGDEWSYPWVFNDGINRLQWVNDTLFVTGSFTEIDGMPAHGVARFVNGEWEGMYEHTDDLGFSIFGAMAFYQGQYYIGGNFESSEGPDDLAILENGELINVGQGLTGAYTSVSNLEVYQDELYISGLIAISQGNIANHILKWNGMEYKNVGDTLYHTPEVLSTSGGVRYMKQKNGFLYIAGGFRFIGNTPIYKVARWDGEKWCGLFTQEFNQNLTFEQSIRAMGFFQDQLLIVHPYVHSDDTYDSYWLYQGGNQVSTCSEIVSISKIAKEKSLTVFPNPISQDGQNTIYINTPGKIESYRIVDYLGRELKINTNSIAQSGDGLSSIHLPSLSSGIYLIIVNVNDNEYSQKLVVTH